MKYKLFNVSFTATFLCVLSLIFYTFSDTLIGALATGEELFPEEKSLGVNFCQKWTEDTREFNVKSGEEANRLAVLSYQKIINEEQVNEDHFTSNVLLSEFEKQMAFLASQNYVALTAEEFYLYMQNKMTVPQNSILITFDEADKNNFEFVYPILKKYNFTAINFIDTSQIKEKNHNPMQGVTVDDLQKSCDVFDYQSHTYNFHQRDEEGKAFLVSKTKTAIRNDMKISLANLNKKSIIFSYPYGEYDEDTIDVLKQLNIKMAFTLENKDVRPGMDLYKIPRKAILFQDDMESFKKKINSVN